MPGFSSKSRRNSLIELFCKADALKNFGKLTGKHFFWTPLLIKEIQKQQEIMKLLTPVFKEHLWCCY